MLSWNVRRWRKRAALSVLAGWLLAFGPGCGSKQTRVSVHVVATPEGRFDPAALSTLRVRAVWGGSPSEWVEVRDIGSLTGDGQSVALPLVGTESGGLRVDVEAWTDGEVTVDGASELVAVARGDEVTLEVRLGPLGLTPCEVDADCDDGRMCNGAETCSAEGVCVAGEAATCDDGDACTLDTCVADSDECRHEALSCDDGNACTEDSCDSAMGCVFATSADGTSCTEGNPCAGEALCFGGECVLGAPPNCDDGDPCTDDACVDGTGCVSTTSADGAACDDSDPCNGHETCSAGSCTAGAPLVCDDGSVCTTDSCVTSLGCVYEPVPAETSCGVDLYCRVADGAPACLPAQCMDGLDNDGDGLADFPDDPGCLSDAGNNEACRWVSDMYGYAGCFAPEVAVSCPDLRADSSAATIVSCDDCTTTIPLPFPFDFYGAAQTTLTVSSNGTMGFPVSSSTGGSTLDANMIAPYWDDLDPSSGGQVLWAAGGVAPDRVVEVQWDVPHYNESEPFDIRALLHENGDIEFCYVQVDVAQGLGASATVGVAGPTTAAAQLPFGDPIANGDHVLIVHP